MIIIAKFVRPLFYFWIFGIISVLLDLDHIIQVYRNGMELSIENLAQHGTRPLHIPVLIFVGIICIITAALLIRFWNLSKRYNHLSEYSMFAQSSPRQSSKPLLTQSLRLKLGMAINAVLPKIKARTPVELPGQAILVEPEGEVTCPHRAHALIVECPKCYEYIGVIPNKTERTEFPCPYCGTEGFFSLSGS